MSALVLTHLSPGPFTIAQPLARLSLIGRWIKTIPAAVTNKPERLPASWCLHEVPPNLLKDAGIDPATVHPRCPYQLRHSAMLVGL